MSYRCHGSHNKSCIFCFLYDWPEKCWLSLLWLQGKRCYASAHVGEGLKRFISFQFKSRDIAGCRTTQSSHGEFFDSPFSCLWLYTVCSTSFKLLNGPGLPLLLHICFYLDISRLYDQPSSIYRSETKFLAALSLPWSCFWHNQHCDVVTCHRSMRLQCRPLGWWRVLTDRQALSLLVGQYYIFTWTPVDRFMSP